MAATVYMACASKDPLIFAPKFETILVLHLSVSLANSYYKGCFMLLVYY